MNKKGTQGAFFSSSRRSRRTNLYHNQTLSNCSTFLRGHVSNA